MDSNDKYVMQDHGTGDDKEDGYDQVMIRMTVMMRMIGVKYRNADEDDDNYMYGDGSVAAAEDGEDYKLES